MTEEGHRRVPDQGPPSWLHRHRQSITDVARDSVSDAELLGKVGLSQIRTHQNLKDWVMVLMMAVGAASKKSLLG